MAQPTMSDVHVNTPLTNLSVMYQQQEDAFVASRVAPIVPVLKASDRYYVYTRADFNRDDMAKRAPGAESAGTGYRLDNTPTYSCDVWSLHKDIPDQVRANMDSVLAPDLEATKFLAIKSLISREIQWASNFFVTGKWNTEYSGVASGAVAGTSVLKWSDGSSNPISDVRYMKRAIQLKSGGYRPNKLVLARSVFDTLLDHPDFVDRVKYGQTAPQPAKVNAAVLATIFEVDEVLIMDSIYNSAIEGGTAAAPTETNAFIAGDNALLCYVPPAPTLMSVASMLTFAWTGYFGASAQGTRIKSFYMFWTEVTRVEIDAAYALKMVGADLGGLFLGVI